MLQAKVQSLVRELDPTCHNYRSRRLQLRSWYGQINKKREINKILKKSTVEILLHSHYDGDHGGKKIITNVGEDVKKLEPLHTLGGM